MYDKYKILNWILLLRGIVLLGPLANLNGVCKLYGSNVAMLIF